MKKVAIIIASRGFQDREYFITKEVLENAGVEVKTVSNKAGTAVGFFGGGVEVDLTLENLKPEDFDAVVFVGGDGCLKNLDNEISYGIARKAVALGKILAAICISPVILAKAGVLKEKKATVWGSAMEKWPIKILKENGAIYEAKPVVGDGNIVTADGPSAAEEFGKTILEKL